LDPQRARRRRTPRRSGGGGAGPVRAPGAHARADPELAESVLPPPAANRMSDTIRRTGLCRAPAPGK
jgi:hypothetical protein